MKIAEAPRMAGIDLRPWETNIQTAAVEILKTLLLFEKNYGINILARVLRGEESKFGEVKSLEELETFGALPRYSHYDLRLIIENMVLKGLIEPTDSNFTTLRITEMGEKYLDAPQPLVVDTMEVSFQTSEYFILRKFLDFRKKECGEKELFPYELYNDFTLDRLVKEKPKNLKHLRLIPGMTHEKAETYGPFILGILKDAQKNWDQIRLAEATRKCKHSTHKSVLEYFKKGHEVEEISRLLSLADITVKLYLCDFHQLGEINIQGEIETWIRPQDLQRGAEYFRNMVQPRIPEAARTLGMDPLTVQICQAYAMDVTKLEPVTA